MYAQAVRKPPVPRRGRANNQVRLNMFKGCAFSDVGLDCIKYLKLGDPCMGSGHILVYVFDVLMQIYESAGYGQRDAARSILENNIYGLDIDDRAFQMAYFAVMMKARQYNRRILNEEYVPNVYSIQESNGINRNQLKYFGKGFNELEKDNVINQITGLLDTFIDAKEYGSILNVDPCDWDLLMQFVENIAEPEQMDLELDGIEKTQERLNQVISQGKLLEQKYEVVVTNPPYMSSSGMGRKLSSYIRDNYYDSRADLFAVFIERCRSFTATYYLYGMITQHAWMFLESFEALRNKIMTNTIINMAHLGPRAFDDIGGEIVQTSSFVIQNHKCIDYNGAYLRLVNEGSQTAKEEAYLTKSHIYYSSQKDNKKIPGIPVAYWMSKDLRSAFKNHSLAELGDSYQGIITGDVNKFLRVWHEISVTDISFCENDYTVLPYTQTYYPYIKGGSYRKWGGNQSYVLRWMNDGKELVRSRTENRSLFFKEGITWSLITTTELSFRWFDQGFLCDVSGSSYYSKDRKRALYILAFLNSKVSSAILHVLNPTMNINIRDILLMPLKEENEEQVFSLAKKCIEFSNEDWNAFETSWNFDLHPLVKGKENNEHRYNQSLTIEECYRTWVEDSNNRFILLKENEETINRIFIEMYGLQDELSPVVEDKNVTVHRADLKREIKSLLSYAIGCMFGRYSLGESGLAYAGGEWDEQKFRQFKPDRDNIIPISDEEYLEDDIVSRLCTWLKVVYGKDTLEENLDFIANTLGNKGSSSREIIRNYFLSDFFKDHCQTYSVTGSGKRPIYWLFDSGKQNGFKALIYLHRYNADTIGNLRIDYLHRMQRIYESEINRMQDLVDHSTSARESAQATKRREKLTKQLKECREYDEKLAHLALSRIELDLDDGVKVNYRKLQTASDGKFYEVLADSKNIMAKK